MKSDKIINLPGVDTVVSSLSEPVKHFSNDPLNLLSKNDMSDLLVIRFKGLGLVVTLDISLTY